MFEKKLWPSLALFILIIAAVLYFTFLHPSKPLPEEKHDKLEDIEVRAYEAFMDRCNLLISLATAFIGAIGLILIWEKKGDIRTNNFQKSFVIVSAILAGFSIYFGYITYCRIIEFLSNKMFNLKQLNPYLEIPILGQFWTFLAAILFFIIFIFIDIYTLKRQ